MSPRHTSSTPIPAVSRTRASALLAAAALISVPIAAATPSRAEVIPNAIDSVQTQGTVRVGDGFRLVATWSVPDHSQPGDTFTLTLPPELTPLQRTFPITTPDGSVVATAEAVDGNVVVTLSDFVSTHPTNISGRMEFNALVSADATPGQPLTITFG